MKDLIERQAAIDAVLGACKDTATTECAVRELEELPSAQPEQPERCSDCEWWTNQPEIIRCKDCKHWDGVDACDVIDAPVWDNDFCSLAERRSDE